MNLKKFRYLHIADDIRSQIHAGYLNPGDYLSSEKDLCVKYDSSRNTLRQALDTLLKEGLLIKMVGKGTMIADRPDHVENDNQSLLVMCPHSSKFADQALHRLIKAFTEAYPRVTVNVFRTDEMNRMDVKKWLELGIQPDLFLIWDRDYHEADLSDYLPLAEVTTKQTTDYGRLYEAFATDGVPYAIPVTLSPVFLTCNRQVFQEQGLALPTHAWTLDEFTEVARSLNKDCNGDGIIDRYGFGMSDSWSRWPVLAFANGFRFERTSDGRLSERGLVSSLRLLQRMLYRDGIAPIAAIDDSSFINDMFEKGKIGMQLSTIFTTPIFKQRDRYHVAPLPSSTEHPGEQGAKLLIANAFMISKYSKNAAMAKHFIQFAVSRDFQERMVEETGFLSTWDELNQKILSNEEAAAFSVSEKGIQDSLFLSQMLPSSRAFSVISHKLRAFWAGMQTPEEAAQVIQDIFLQESEI
ncbi:extracellular solute-binding protein [Paenibacillus sp. 2RAB27]|uniref:ABC transporter substrate-binding protein n=1 Tax=Paenibacillus sp. 2RAB27 TaxID=3232991 RepID=UPI003F9B1F2F